MRRHDLDIILCHWPLLGLASRFVPANELIGLEDTKLFIAINATLGVVYLAAVIYGIFRVTTLGIKGWSLVGWIFGIICFSFISLPYLFWSRLWELRDYPPQA